MSYRGVPTSALRRTPRPDRANRREAPAAPWRARAAIGAASVVGLALVLQPSQAATPAPTFVPGSGAASATLARVRLFYGGLSLPVSIGVSAASYTNQQSKALGVAAEPSSITGLAGVRPEQLATLSIDSNAGDTAKTAQLAGGGAVGAVSLQATRRPAAMSDVHLDDLSLATLVRVEGGHSTSASEVVGGVRRRAASSASFSKIDIGGGAVVLDDVQWSATQQTGADALATGTFTIGGLLVAGRSVPVSAGDAGSSLDAVNSALAPVGLILKAPLVEKTVTGGVVVGPLRIAIDHSPLGAKLVGPAVASARPFVTPVLEALTAKNSTLGLAGLVSDVALGVADGSGGVEVTLGGVSATTAATAFVPAAAPSSPATLPAALPSNVDLGSPSLPSPTSSDTGSGAVTPQDATDPVAPASTGEVAASTAVVSESVRCALVAAPQRHGGCRSGNLPGAVGVTAVAFATLALAEVVTRRRRMLADARAATMGSGS